MLIATRFSATVGKCTYLQKFLRLAWRPGKVYHVSNMRNVEAGRPVPSVDGPPPDACPRYSGMDYAFSLTQTLSSPRACQLPGASYHRLAADIFPFSPNDSEHRRHGTSCYRFAAGMEFSFSSRGSQHRRHGERLVPIRRRCEIVLLS